MTRTITIEHCNRSVGVYGHTWATEPLQHQYLFVSKWRDTALNEEDKAGYRTRTFVMTLTVGLPRKAVSRAIRNVARHIDDADRPDDLVCLTTDPQYRLTEEALYVDIAY